jgi:hypothetical protein
MKRGWAIIKGRATFGGQDKGHSSRDRRMKENTRNNSVNIGDREDRNIVYRNNV